MSVSRDTRPTRVRYTLATPILNIVLRGTPMDDYRRLFLLLAWIKRMTSRPHLGAVIPAQCN